MFFLSFGVMVFMCVDVSVCVVCMRVHAVLELLRCRVYIVFGLCFCVDILLAYTACFRFAWLKTDFLID